MKGYKAFEKGMICRDKQYAENTVFEEENAEICESGMHFCKNPLDVLDYYPLVDENGNITEFAEVETQDEVFTDDNKKFCTKKLKIGAKINFANLLQASVEFKKETKVKCTSKDRAQIGSSGNWAKIGSSGYWAQIGSSGNWAQIGSSGNWAQIGSSGDWAQIGSSGNWAQIGSSGDGAKIGSSGYGAQIGSSGDGAVIMCAGRNSSAKGKKGSWITLSEWKFNEKENRYIPVCVKTEQIDGERIKENVFYTLKNGEFVEVGEDE